jgi:hypothetical protein
MSTYKKLALSFLSALHPISGRFSCANCLLPWLAKKIFKLAVKKPTPMPIDCYMHAACQVYQILPYFDITPEEQKQLKGEFYMQTYCWSCASVFHHNCFDPCTHFGFRCLTPLHVAALNGHLGCAIQYSLHLDSVNHVCFSDIVGPQTPLDMALKTKYLDVIEFLIKKGGVVCGD